MAELLNRKPVFPGKDYVDQIKVILRTIGSPGDADKAFITNKKARDHVSGLGSFKKMPWEQKFPKAAQENPESLKLLDAMLQAPPSLDAHTHTVQFRPTGENDGFGSAVACMRCY
jgi:mitogen-activated protein kinase 1/3